MFGWSLYEIDRTDIESLLAFVMHTPADNNHRDTETPRKTVKREIYCDQVSWL